MQGKEACSKCGELTPVYQLNQGLCEGCKLDTWLPKRYHNREGYEYIPEYKHYNATRHPKTGVPLLDMTPLRLSQIAFPKGVRPCRVR
jgi:hypothetical protein